jgi:hypothetical protein
MRYTGLLLSALAIVISSWSDFNMWYANYGLVVIQVIIFMAYFPSFLTKLFLIKSENGRNTLLIGLQTHVLLVGSDLWYSISGKNTTVLDYLYSLGIVSAQVYIYRSTLIRDSDKTS